MKTVTTLDETQLRLCCTLSIDDLIKSIAKQGWAVGGTKGNAYLYWKRPGNKVLGVAHMDTVSGLKNEFLYEPMAGKDPNKKYYWTPYGDDRAGVFILLNYLPKLLGSAYDILLTTGEETGSTSARQFKTDVQYNWLFEFDRRETEVVMYSYSDSKLGENGFFPKLLNLFDFKYGSGSFSDIEALGSLGVTGFNIGTGYYQEHTQDSYIDPEVLQAQCAKFVKMFTALKDVRLPFDPNPKYGVQTYGYYGRSYREGTAPSANPKGVTVHLNGGNSGTSGIGTTSKFWKKRDWLCQCKTNYNHAPKVQKCRVCNYTRNQYLAAIKGQSLYDGTYAESGEVETWGNSKQEEIVALRVAIEDAVGSAVLFKSTFTEYLEEFDSDEEPIALTYRVNSRASAMEDATNSTLTPAEVKTLLEEGGGNYEFVAGKLDELGFEFFREITGNITFAGSSYGAIGVVRVIMLLLKELELSALVGLIRKLKNLNRPVNLPALTKLANVIKKGSTWKAYDLWLDDDQIRALKDANYMPSESTPEPKTESKTSKDSPPTAATSPSTAPEGLPKSNTPLPM